MTVTNKPAADHPQDRLLPFGEAIKVVGCSRAKIYLLLGEEQFPRPIKVGRNNYFSERELQDWIRERLDARAVRA